MEGRALAAKRQFELMISQAWHTEAFARAKKLKPLLQYLDGGDEQKAQTPDQMLSILREINSRGAPMTIVRVD